MWLRLALQKIAQWSGLQEEGIQDVERYRGLAPEEQQAEIERRHGRHNPDLVKFFHICANIESEYIKKILVPQFPVKTLRLTYNAYVGKKPTDKSDAFQELLSGLAEDATLSQQDVNAINDVCLYAHIFGTDAPSILEKMKRKCDLHATASLIQSTIPNLNHIISGSFKDYIRKILDMSSENFSKMVSVAGLLYENTDKPGELSFAEIKECIKKNEQLLESMIHSAQDAMFLEIVSQGKIRGWTTSGVLERYNFMKECLEKRAGRDNVPTFELSRVIEAEEHQRIPEYDGCIVQMRRIPIDDVRQLSLGSDDEYHCCYFYGGASSDAVKYSIENPNAANYEVVLLDADGTLREKLATSFVWVYDGNVVFDNIETSNFISQDAGYAYPVIVSMIRQLYIELGQKMVSEMQGKFAVMGSGYVENDDFLIGDSAIWEKRDVHPILREILSRRHYNVDGLLKSPAPESIAVPTPYDLGYSDANESQYILYKTPGATVDQSTPWVHAAIFQAIVKTLEENMLYDEEREFLIKQLDFHYASSQTPYEIEIDRDDVENGDQSKSAYEDVREWLEKHNVADLLPADEDPGPSEEEVSDRLYDEMIDELNYAKRNWRSAIEFAETYCSYEFDEYYEEAVDEARYEYVEEQHAEWLREYESKKEAFIEEAKAEWEGQPSDGEDEEPDWEEKWEEYFSKNEEPEPDWEDEYIPPDKDDLATDFLEIIDVSSVFDSYIQGVDTSQYTNNRDTSWSEEYSQTDEQAIMGTPKTWAPIILENYDSMSDQTKKALALKILNNAGQFQNIMSGQEMFDCAKEYFGSIGDNGLKNIVDLAAVYNIKIPKNLVEEYFVTIPSCIPGLAIASDIDPRTLMELLIKFPDSKFGSSYPAYCALERAKEMAKLLSTIGIHLDYDNLEDMFGDMGKYVYDYIDANFSNRPNPKAYIKSIDAIVDRFIEAINSSDDTIDNWAYYINSEAFYLQRYMSDPEAVKYIRGRVLGACDMSRLKKMEDYYALRQNQGNYNVIATIIGDTETVPEYYFELAKGRDPRMNMVHHILRSLTPLDPENVSDAKKKIDGAVTTAWFKPALVAFIHNMPPEVTPQEKETARLLLNCMYHPADNALSHPAFSNIFQRESEARARGWFKFALGLASTS